MKKRVGLVLLTKRIPNNPGVRWDTVEQTVRHYHSLYDNFTIYLCGNGPQESPTEEVVKKIHSYNTLPMFDIQNLVRLGLEQATESAHSHCLVINGPLLCSDLSFMVDDKVLLLAQKSRREDMDSKSLRHDFMFGKTETLMRMWTNRPFNCVMSDQCNMYKNVFNIFGRKGIYESDKLSMKTAEELYLKKATA